MPSHCMMVEAQRDGPDLCVQAKLVSLFCGEPLRVRFGSAVSGDTILVQNWDIAPGIRAPFHSRTL